MNQNFKAANPDYGTQIKIIKKENQDSKIKV